VPSQPGLRGGPGRLITTCTVPHVCTRALRFPRTAPFSPRRPTSWSSSFPILRPVVRAVLPASLTSMRVTQKGQVTIPLEIRKALGIHAGSEVQFRLEEDGARLVVGRQRAERELARMRGAGDVDLSTDEILALTRR
jgi:antitoxin PrlF